MEKLKFTLRENAHDFLEDAIANAVAAESSPKRWKFAILSMVQSIELALKALLTQVHPLLINSNIDKPGHTVTLDIAVSRLKTIRKLSLTENELKALTLAKKTRHQIIHHEVDANIKELQLAFSRLLGFLSDFYDSHFDSSLCEEVDEKLWASAMEIKFYGQELFDRAEKRIQENIDYEYDEIADCPHCGWKSMLVKEDNHGHCYMCGREEKMVFCEKCNKEMIEGEQYEELGKTYCLHCLEYESSDYWYEQSAGK